MLFNLENHQIVRLKTMTQPIPNRTPRRGRIFPEIQWTEAEKAKRKSESEAFYQRCWKIFDIDRETAQLKARHAHPDSIHCLFRLDGTGACGTI